MIELMRFWLFSGFLLAGAAWSVDTLLRNRGVQLRGVWASAMGLTLLSPVLPRLDWFTSGAHSLAAPRAPTDGGATPVLAAATESSALLGFLSDPVVLAAWAAVSAALLIMGTAVLLRLRKRARSWRPARVRGEDVLFAPDFGPAVVGITDPAIVLPESLRESEATDVELILRHEREHIQARDPWLLLASAAAVACMPWNVPLVWQAFRLRAAVEEDCDARVLRSGVNPRRYGDLLVRMACHPTGFGFAAAAMSERPSGLRRRLERLRNQRGQTRVALMALLVIAGAGAIGVWMGMPSPLSLWQGHGPGSSTAEFHFKPVAPVAPLPPMPMDSEARKARLEELAHLKAELAARMKDAEGQLKESVLRYNEALLRMNKVNESANDEAGRAKAEEQLQQAQVTLETHERLLAEMRDRIRNAEAQTADAERFGLRVPRAEFEYQERNPDAYRYARPQMRERVEASGNPLIVVDGEVFDGDVADIDPNTVDRIEVLKGGAAIGPYGEKGANGVVSIHLKGTPQGSGRN